MLVERRYQCQKSDVCAKIGGSLEVVPETLGSIRQTNRCLWSGANNYGVAAIMRILGIVEGAQTT